MRNESYLIHRVVLHLILVIFAIWGLHYAASRIGEYLENFLIEATFQEPNVTL